jgi:hypothetical protein
LRIKGGTQRDPALAGLGTHGIQGIAQQIEDHLLQQDSITGRGWQALGQVQDDRHLMRPGLMSEQRFGFACDQVHVHRTELRLALLHEASNASNDFTGPLCLGVDGFEPSLHLALLASASNHVLIANLGDVDGSFAMAVSDALKPLFNGIVVLGSSGGQTVALIATVSPATVNMAETLSTLRFADNTKRIKNKVSLGPLCGRKRLKLH